MAEDRIFDVASTRSQMLRLLTTGAVCGAIVPSTLVLDAAPAGAATPCVTTELSADGLIQSASYDSGGAHIVMKTGVVGAKSHRLTVTSGSTSVLSIDSDFSKLGGGATFGSATMRLSAGGSTIALTIDGSKIAFSPKTGLPKGGTLPIRVQNGAKTTVAPFDLATWKLSPTAAPLFSGAAMEKLNAMLTPFVPSFEAGVGYVAHHSPLDLNFMRRPLIANGLGLAACIALCTLAFLTALMICGAAAPAGPVGWAVCCAAAGLAFAMCKAAC